MITTNTGAKKIEGTDNWREIFDAHNDTVDALESNIAKVNSGLAYVENGATIAANANYTEGKFICWKGELYRVKAGKTINTTVTSSNWSTYLTKQDGIGGALSTINSELSTLNSNLLGFRVFTAVGTGQEVTDYADLPVNSVGRVRFSGTLSPTGAALLMSYMSFGSGFSFRTIIAIQTSTARTFINSISSDKWTGWREIIAQS